jgi:hypothetical protein
MQDGNSTLPANAILFFFVETKQSKKRPLHEFMTDLKRTLDGNSNKSIPHPRGAASLRPQGSNKCSPFAVHGSAGGRKQIFFFRAGSACQMEAARHWALIATRLVWFVHPDGKLPARPFFKPPAAYSEEREGLSCDPPAPVEAWTGANRVRAEETEEISGRARCRPIGGSNPARPRSTSGIYPGSHSLPQVCHGRHPGARPRPPSIHSTKSNRDEGGPFSGLW